MPGEKSEFCQSRAGNAYFEPMCGYRHRLKPRDVGLSNATYGACDARVIRARRP